MRISSTPTTRDTTTREAPSVADTSWRSIGRSVPTAGRLVKESLVKESIVRPRSGRLQGCSRAQDPRERILHLR